MFLRYKILGQESNSECSKKAIFIPETLGLIHCKSAFFDKN